MTIPTPPNSLVNGHARAQQRKPLPEFPRSTQPLVNQLKKLRDEAEHRIRVLRMERDRAEKAFGKAFDRADENTGTADRIAALAEQSRKKGRR